MKRLLVVASFLALAAFASAQSMLSGSVFSQTFTGGTNGSGFGASGAFSSIDYTQLGAAFQPGTYTGDYKLTVTISADASDSYWSSFSATPKLTASYETGASTIVLGSYAFTADGSQSYSSTFSYSDALRGTIVDFDYTRFSLNSGNTLALTATYTLTAVPEPATYALLLGAGTLGLVGYRRFRRK